MRFGLKLVMIIAFTIINLLGLREVGVVSSILSVAIIIAFGVVAAVGIINWNYNPIEPFIAEELSASEAISGTLAICIWMYCGYECISTLAGEVKNPQVIPKGLLIAMPLIAATYVLPTLGGLVSVGDYSSWGTEGDAVGYADVLTQNLGAVWGYIFLAIAIISQCAIFNTYLASGSRGFFVLADDNLCPKFLVKVSKKRGVPYVGVLSLAVVTALLAQFEFTTLVMAEVVFILALYILLPLSVLKLRKKYPIEERRKQNLYVMPGGNKGVYFFAGIVLVIAVIAFMINGTDYFLIGIIACTTGPLFYVNLKRAYGGFKDDEKYPLNPRTKLAMGDLRNLSVYGLFSGILAVVGSFVLAWYEGDWGAEYYASEAESSFFTDFYWMLDLLRYIGIGLIIFGIVMWLLGRKFGDKRIG
jgi:amino acid transporter